MGGGSEEREYSSMKSLKEKGLGYAALQKKTELC
jgi:hypothetical protein